MNLYFRKWHVISSSHNTMHGPTSPSSSHANLASPDACDLRYHTSCLPFIDDTSYEADTLSTKPPWPDSSSKTLRYNWNLKFSLTRVFITRLKLSLHPILCKRIDLVLEPWKRTIHPLQMQGVQKCLTTLWSDKAKLCKV